MKYKRFDVVELNNGNRATILDIKKNYYNVEIVNPYGITLDKKFISNDEIKGLICSSKRINSKRIDNNYQFHFKKNILKKYF